MSSSLGRAGARGARAARGWCETLRACGAAPSEALHAAADAACSTSRERSGPEPCIVGAEAAGPRRSRRGVGGNGAAAAVRPCCGAARRGFAAQAAPAPPVDPFSIVSDELEAVSERMRRAVVSEARTLPRTHSGPHVVKRTPRLRSPQPRPAARLDEAPARARGR
jgi:hypothetical protein